MSFKKTRMVSTRANRQIKQSSIDLRAILHAAIDKSKQRKKAYNHIIVSNAIHYNSFILKNCPTCGKGDVMISLAQELNKTTNMCGRHVSNR